MKNKGITLVALIITVIILLILAGITISQLTGSGLFGNAKLAEEKWDNSQSQEDETLEDYENVLNGYISSNREQVMVDKEEYENLKSKVSTLETEVYYLENNYIDCAILKTGNVKEVIFYNTCKKAMTAGTAYILGTLPEEYRPSIRVSHHFVMGASTSVENFAHISIDIDGIVKLTPYSARTTSNYLALSFTYI